MPDELVTIAEFESQAEFVVARSMLESAGIECFVENENFVRTVKGLSVAFGIHGIKLRVRATDAEDANQVLQAEWPPLP